jgi:hypothetical protein
MPQVARPKIRPPQRAPRSNTRRFWTSWFNLNVYIYRHLAHRKAVKLGLLTLFWFARLVVSLASGQFIALVFGISLIALSLAHRVLAGLAQLHWSLIVIGTFVLFALALRFFWFVVEQDWYRDIILHLEKVSIIDNEDLAVEFSKYQPAQEFKREGYCLVQMPNAGQYIHRSKQVDSFLRRSRLLFREKQHGLDSVKRRLRAQGIEMEAALRDAWTDAMNEKRDFRNEPKLCLLSDVRLGGAVLTVAASDYYTGWLTNQYCAKKIWKGTSVKIAVRNGSHSFPFDRRQGVLRPIGESDLANIIGVSTIAHTADNLLVFWRQNNQAMMSQLKLAPTGSGSCDVRDFHVSHNDANSVEVAMMRELLEESKLVDNYQEDEWLHAKPSSPIKNTQIIGHFRWVNQGGKPEFVGATKLAVVRDMLRPDEREVQASADSGLAGVRGGKQARSLTELRAAIDDVLESSDLSVPLWVNLQSLKEAVTEDPDRWAKFFEIPR